MLLIILKTGMKKVGTSNGGVATAVVKHKDDEMQDADKGLNDETDKESDDESIRDDDSCFDVDVGKSGEFYSVEQINNFLDETKGRSVEIEEVFPDLDKFVASVMKVRRDCSVEVLSQKKRFRLKKYLTVVRQKMRKEKGKRRSTRTNSK